jgi:hypothetical protein
VVRTCPATFTKTANREASTSSFQIRISTRTHHPDLRSFPAPLVLSCVLAAVFYPILLHRTIAQVYRAVALCFIVSPRKKKGPGEVTTNGYRTNMYQMRWPGPSSIQPSLHPSGGQNNVYYARPRADYVLCSYAITIN